jgi:hypothetical protein
MKSQRASPKIVVAGHAIHSFIDHTLDGNRLLWLKDSQAWEDLVHREINMLCCGLLSVHWELVTGSLAVKLNTGYDEGEEYAFILNLLANAATVRRKKRCHGCKEKLYPQYNALLMVCPACGTPVHEWGV